MLTKTRKSHDFGRLQGTIFLSANAPASALRVRLPIAHLLLPILAATTGDDALGKSIRFHAW
jgi:hypothetical protein